MFSSVNMILQFCNVWVNSLKVQSVILFKYISHVKYCVSKIRILYFGYVLLINEADLDPTIRRQNDHILWKHSQPNTKIIITPDLSNVTISLSP